MPPVEGLLHLVLVSKKPSIYYEWVIVLYSTVQAQKLRLRLSLLAFYRGFFLCPVPGRLEIEGWWTNASGLFLPSCTPYIG
jgi:hypothetical protein